MSRVVITGVAGTVGSRVASRLAEHPDVSSVTGIDIKPLADADEIEMHVGDLTAADAAGVFEGADAVVHLASRFTPSRDGTSLTEVDTDATTQTLRLASEAGVRRLVVLSSAMVYGAWENNPIPITEAAAVKPNTGFSFAEEKAELERWANSWRDDHPQSRVAVLRPTTALAAGEASWVARTMRASAALASDHEPPVQFLHLDDLADAVVIATTKRLDGAFNVAPDGWVEGSEVRQLVGRAPRIPLPAPIAAQVALAKIGRAHV